MKRTLSLIAILGLLLSLSLITSASARAPFFPDIPDLKLAIGTGLTPAFDLSCFNTGDAATSYSITANFAGLSSLTANSIVDEGGWASATIGLNTYRADNDGGFGTHDNKVKWSTFQIDKLPKVGLGVGKSWTVNVGSKVHGTGYPTSFGLSAAIIVSDPTKVTATWSGTTDVITISLISAATVPVNVDIIASNSATPTASGNFDKERITVYPNLLNAGEMDTLSDVNTYAAQIPGGFTALPTIGWSSAQADGAGTVAEGVMTVSCADATNGVKLTPAIANWITMTNGSWYLARSRAMTLTGGNNSQYQLYCYDGQVGAHVDISNDNYFGIPTTWTYFESPIIAKSTQSAQGYAQLFVKAAGAIVVNIDNLQILQTAPTLIDASRQCTKLRYPYGSDTTGFSIQTKGDSPGGLPALSVANGQIQADFAGASDAAVKGFKATATNNSVNVYQPPVIQGKEVGIYAVTTVLSGAFSNVNALLQVACYGVSSATADPSDWATGGQIIALSEFGTNVIGGNLYGIAEAKKPNYQFQFQAKNREASVLGVSAIDLDWDQDTFNYGDQALFQ